jgi:DnaK suppressor protein
MPVRAAQTGTFAVVPGRAAVEQGVPVSNQPRVPNPSDTRAANESADRLRLEDERVALIDRIAALDHSEAAVSASQASREVKTDITSGEGDSLSVARGEIKTLRQGLERRLVAIDAALEALDAGAYGVCVGCGDAIAPERLEALPGVDRCVACASAPGGSR